MKFSSITENRYFDFFSSVLLFLFVYLIRFPILVPKGESDEISFCIIGRALSSGMKIYSEVGHYKGPLRYYMFAIFDIITGGLTPVSLRISFIFLMAISVVLFYFTVKNLFQDKQLAFITALYWGISDYLLSHNTIITYTYALAGLLFFSFYYRKKNLVNLFIMGIFFGLAILTNQRSFPLMPVAGLFLLIRFGLFKKEFYQHGFTIAAGFFLPVIITIIHLCSIGSFDDFLFQVFDKALAYREPRGAVHFLIVPFGKIVSVIRYQLGFLFVFLIYNLVDIFKKKKFMDEKYQFLLIWLFICYVATFIDHKYVKRYNLFFLIPSVIFTIQGIFLFYNNYNEKLKSKLKQYYPAMVCILIIISSIHIAGVFHHEISRRINTYKTYKYHNKSQEQMSELLEKHVDADKDMIYAFDRYMFVDTLYKYKPASRFVYSLEQLLDKKAVVSERYRLDETWQLLYLDLEKNKPAMIIDTTKRNLHSQKDYENNDMNMYRDRFVDYVISRYTMIDSIDGIDFYLRK
jgi:hypothetical protein